MTIPTITAQPAPQQLSSPGTPVAGIIQVSPRFNGYIVSLPPNHVCNGMVMTALSTRPNNLAYEAIFRGSGIRTTLPGSGELFAFKGPSHHEIRTFLASKDPREVVSFSARGSVATIRMRRGEPLITAPLGSILGTNTYQISYGEIMSCLDSQMIFLSPQMPKLFYTAFKKAMLDDRIIELPDCRLNECLNRNIKDLLAQVSANPTAFGFQSEEAFNTFKKLHLYEIGTMIVKRENYYVFVDEHGKILTRTANSPDALRLINACGIRDINDSTPNRNLALMTNTFKAALIAAESGMVIFPAVGMGIWRGPPEIYWTAFLIAVLEAPVAIEQIFVCPGHQNTSSGTYQGRNGDEFAEFLQIFQSVHPGNRNLAKIVNLFAEGKDMIHLARHLKSAYSDKTISIFNASDPDVTLGNHVGEYANNQPHVGPTTEENLTVIGTNGLCFEGITDIHQEDGTPRIIQVREG
jgi:hypothetical protein